MSYRFKVHFIIALILGTFGIILYYVRGIYLPDSSQLKNVDLYSTPLVYSARSPPVVPLDFLPGGVSGTDNRIRKQLSLEPRVQNSSSRPKVILDLTTNYFPEGQTPFLEKKCPVNTCTRLTWSDIEKNPDLTIDAVLVLSVKELPRAVYPKQPGTIWIFFSLESPLNTASLSWLNNLVNWTATYRADSTIVVPYWQYEHGLKTNPDGDYMKTSKGVNEVNANIKKYPVRNYAAGKTKLVAWFVSNCDDKSGRLMYARQLNKQIQVDIYGTCGPLECPRRLMDSCLDTLKRDYKFYLAFENSRCKDYITEKIIHALMHDVVPIVLGAPKEDYERMAPPGSFIHVDDFRSPEQLAQYLQYLSKNDTAYNQYFLWKGHGEFVDNKFMCRICALLHQPLPAMWYEDMDAWWRGKDSSICDLSEANID